MNLFGGIVSLGSGLGWVALLFISSLTARFVASCLSGLVAAILFGSFIGLYVQLACC